MPHALHLLPLIIAVILVVSLLASNFAARIGQTAVIGEAFVGILLGPLIVLGAERFPNFEADISGLNTLAEIGLVLLLFHAGLELDLKTLRKNAPLPRQIGFVFFGILLSMGVGFLTFIVAKNNATNFQIFFCGLAFAATAVPVLLRILEDLELTDSPIGQTSLLVAVITDMFCWIGLAGIAVIKNGMGLQVGSIVWFLIALAAVALIWRRLLRPAIAGGLTSDSSAARGESSLVLILMVGVFFLSAMSSFAQLHLGFGALIVGILASDSNEVREIWRKISAPLVNALLLPIFFVAAGMRLDIGFLFSMESLPLIVCVTLLAGAAKIASGYVIARLSGFKSVASIQVGLLINTRGLTEIVMLNLGYELGVVSPKWYSALLIMALINTALTVPLFRMLTGQKPVVHHPEQAAPGAAIEAYKGNESPAKI